MPTALFGMKPIPDPAHMPQLDGLRAFAVTAVAISHWTPEFLMGIVPWGTGVQLFFVLSGFLITGILLGNRPTDLGVPLGVVLKRFYIRRFLRIFPLYYGVLAFALLLSLGPIHQTWPWHVSYLSNFLFAFHGHGDAVADPYLHFWSLAVEEQFYLLWPFLVLVASPRKLPAILYSFIGGALVFRLVVGHLAPDVTVRYLTPTNLDALGIGALIAHAKHYKGWAEVARWSRRMAWVGFTGLIFSMVVLRPLMGGEPGQRVGHTFLVIIYGFIIAGAAKGFRGPLGAVLTFKPILYLGKISYGLYVFHYFAPAVLDRVARHFGVEALLQRPALALSAYTLLTVALAVVSWHWYEAPLNRLKRRFEYPRNAGAPLRPAAAPAAAPG